MGTRRRCTFWIDDWQDGALKAIKERDGIPEAEQLRRAITAWIEKKGLKIPGARRQPPSGARKGGA